MTARGAVAGDSAAPTASLLVGSVLGEQSRPQVGPAGSQQLDENGGSVCATGAGAVHTYRVELLLPGAEGSGGTRRGQRGAPPPDDKGHPGGTGGKRRSARPENAGERLGSSGRTAGRGRAWPSTTACCAPPANAPPHGSRRAST